jgi:hypothetical protein
LLEVPGLLNNGPFLGKLNETLEYRQKASVRIYYGEPTAGEEDLGFKDSEIVVDVWDFFLLSGESLASGSWISFDYFPLHWIYVARNAVC